MQILHNVSVAGCLLYLRKEQRGEEKNIVNNELCSLPCLSHTGKSRILEICQLLDVIKIDQKVHCEK